MRVLLSLIALAVAANALTQVQGTYRPEKASPVEWSINANHTLVWNGVPYIPAGVRISGTLDEIAKAKKDGATDVIADLPVGQDWGLAVRSLEEGKMRYLLSVQSAAPGAHGFAVEPQTYRIGGITESRKIEFTIPGASSALVLLVSARDGAVIKSDKLDLPGGKLSYEAKLVGSAEHILLVYPELTSMAEPDYWEGFDLQRDAVLTSMKHAHLGEGYRGLVNPMGEYLSLTSSQGFVPTSAFFRMELRTYLLNRYRNLETAQRSWSVSVNDITDFDGLARLVPLWSGSRGVSQLWDPTTNKLYRCNNRQSSVWADVQQVINSAASRRFDRLVSAIRDVADAPIVQEWKGWGGTYEAGKTSLSGIGMRAYGSTPSAINDSGAGAASSLLRWTTPGWLVATSIDAGPQADQATIGNVMSDLSTMGARGFFFRGTHADYVKAEAGNLDSSLAQWSPVPLFYPESAANPASPQRLPGGRFWLPSPGGGNRIDLGSGFYAYRYQDKTGVQTAIWTSGGAGRVKLRLAEPKVAVFTTVDGTDPKIRVSRNGVELTLGPVPVLMSGTDEIPVPEAAFLEVGTKFNALKKVSEAVKHDIAEENFMYKDAVSSFERSPGGSFAQMRKAFWQATYKLAPYVWIEAEQTRTTNFSEYVSVPGASGGGALALSSPSSLDSRGFFAEYTFAVRAGEVDIWVAAKVAPEARKGLKVVIGGQEMSILEDPVMPYGPGFAWYHMGSTSLKGASMKFTVQVYGDESNDMVVDAIMIAPSSITPKGAFPPELIGGGS